MSEKEWIKRYIAPLVTSEGAVGLRDDVAILSTGGVLIVSMDTLVEGVHFLEDDPLETVGRKLVRVNVSDILAKGAAPYEALLSIVWPRGWVEAEFAALIRGISRDFETFGVSLIGGDTVGTEGALSLSLTLTGQCYGDAPVRRAGGSVGDWLWVSGDIGWGHVGLEAALGGGDPAAVKRYRVPAIGNNDVARIVSRNASASMDISDGLLLDTLRLSDASGCGAAINLDKVPLAQSGDGLEVVLEQCTGGDDYVVLVAVPPGAGMPGFTRIGELVEGAGLSLRYKGDNVNVPVTLGFEH